jgi:hypothetical protein
LKKNTASYCSRLPAVKIRGFLSGCWHWFAPVPYPLQSSQSLWIPAAASASRMGPIPALIASECRCATVPV